MKQYLLLKRLNVLARSLEQLLPKTKLQLKELLKRYTFLYYGLIIYVQSRILLSIYGIIVSIQVIVKYQELPAILTIEDAIASSSFHKFRVRTIKLKQVILRYLTK